MNMATGFSKPHMDKESNSSGKSNGCASGKDLVEILNY